MKIVIGYRLQIMGAKFIYFLLLIVCCLLPTCLLSQQWYKIGTGLGYWGVTVGTIKIINDSLYIGGQFGGAAYGGKGNGIVKFNGVSDFDSLGNGIKGSVSSMEYYSGKIYVGGFYNNAALLPNTNSIATWNGAQWDSVPGHLLGNPQYNTLLYKGDLYIGGGFFGGSGNYHNIARFNGTAPWDDVKGGVVGWGGVDCMIIYKGDLIVAGEFNTAGGQTANNIARWDGNNWYALGSGLNGEAAQLAVDTMNNVLYAGGYFTAAGGISSRYIAKWDGTNWSAVPDYPDTCGPTGNFVIFDRKLFSGTGYCNAVNPVDTYLVYLDLNTNSWHAVFGPNNQVYGLEVYKGNLWVGGAFDKIDTTIVNEIACYGDSCPGTPITLTLPYAVYEFEQGLKFKVFPNPAKKEINIKLADGSWQLAKDEKHIVRIKNSLGQSVFEKKFEKELKVNTSDLKKGIYFVEVCNSEGKLCHTEKVVIE